MSQMALALEAGISTRHLSYVETGRAAPGRAALQRLLDVLQTPLGERNAVFLAAGYAPPYGRVGLDAPELAAARAALERILEKHEPYPAVVVDRCWNTVMRNRGAERLLAFFPECAKLDPPNGMRLMLHPNGLRPFVRDWERLAAHLVLRLRREAASNPSDADLRAFVDDVLAYPGLPEPQQAAETDAPPPAFFTIDYRRGDLAISLFSTIATFGTAQDLGLQELRIECFFPADEATRRAFEAA